MLIFVASSILTAACFCGILVGVEATFEVTFPWYTGFCAGVLAALMHIHWLKDELYPRR